MDSRPLDRNGGPIRRRGILHRFNNGLSLGHCCFVSSERLSSQIEERYFVNLDLAPSRQFDGGRCFFYSSDIGEPFTCHGDSMNSEIPLEVVLDLCCRSWFAKRTSQVI